MQNNQNITNNKKNGFLCLNILLVTGIILFCVFVLLVFFTGIVVGRMFHNPKPVTNVEPIEIKQPERSIEEKDNNKIKVNLFFDNPNFNQYSDDCSSVYTVDREVENNEDLFKNTLLLLFQGPNKQELENGYTSIFSANTKNILNNFSIQEGTAYVDLIDIRELLPNLSSSCTSIHFLVSVEATLLQFPEFNKVVYSIEGDSELLYELLQIGSIEE